MFNKLQLDTTAAQNIKSAFLDNCAPKVLLKLMYVVNRNNIILGTPEELCKNMSITRWDFIQGIKALKKHDVIRKYTKREYMLNPDIMYNGDDTRYFIVKHMWDTQTTQGFRNANSEG